MVVVDVIAKRLFQRENVRGGIDSVEGIRFLSWKIIGKSIKIKQRSEVDVPSVPLFDRIHNELPYDLVLFPPTYTKNLTIVSYSHG